MPTVPELRELAKQHGLRGYSKMNKAELLELTKGLSEAEKPASSTVSKPAEGHYVYQKLKNGRSLGTYMPGPAPQQRILVNVSHDGGESTIHILDRARISDAQYTEFVRLTTLSAHKSENLHELIDQATIATIPMFGRYIPGLNERIVDIFNIADWS